MSDRIETGPLRFGDDWAGVFLRGDYAGPMGFYLASLFEAVDAGRKPSPNITMPLRGLAKALAGSDERGSLNGLQQLPDFALCMTIATQGKVLADMLHTLLSAYERGDDISDDGDLRMKLRAFATQLEGK